MSVNRMERLHSFLVEEGRELVNIKFFPGTGRGISSEQVAEAAEGAIRRAFTGGLVDRPPISPRAKTSL